MHRNEKRYITLGAFTNKLVSCLTSSGGGGWHVTFGTWQKSPHSQSRVTAASAAVCLACCGYIKRSTSIDKLCHCDNIGLVSSILLGCEKRVLYHCTMCTRQPDLVSLDFNAIPIFHIRILPVSSFEAISALKKYIRIVWWDQRNHL